MSTKILDSWALMALFHDEPAADAVEKLLEDALSQRNRLLMTVVNWGEIYYSIRRGVSAAMAEEKLREIAAMPIEIIPADLLLTHQAAIFKASHKMSYADCFAAALAKIHGAELATGDPEFQSVAKEIKIRWLK